MKTKTDLNAAFKTAKKLIEASEATGMNGAKRVHEAGIHDAIGKRAAQMLVRRGKLIRTYSNYSSGGRVVCTLHYYEL